MDTMPIISILENFKIHVNVDLDLMVFHEPSTNVSPPFSGICRTVEVVLCPRHCHGGSRRQCCMHAGLCGVTDFPRLLCHQRCESNYSRWRIVIMYQCTTLVYSHALWFTSRTAERKGDDYVLFCCLHHKQLVYTFEHNKMSLPVSKVHCSFNWWF